MSSADLPRMLKQAARLREAGRLRQAAVVYRRALHADPANPSVLYPLALVARDMGRTDAALPLLRRAAAAAPDDPAVHRSLGDLCHALGRSGEAVDAYRVALRHAPDDPQALARVGRAYTKLGRWREAAEAYDRAADLAGMLADPPAGPVMADADEDAPAAVHSDDPAADSSTAATDSAALTASSPAAVFSTVIVTPADLAAGPDAAERAAVAPVGVELTPIGGSAVSVAGESEAPAVPPDAVVVVGAGAVHRAAENAVPAAQAGLESIRLETLDAESFAGAFEIVTPAPGQSAVVPRDLPAPVPGPPPAEPAAVQFEAVPPEALPPEAGPIMLPPPATPPADVPGPPPVEGAPVEVVSTEREGPGVAAKLAASGPEATDVAGPWSAGVMDDAAGVATDYTGAPADGAAVAAPAGWDVPDEAPDGPHAPPAEPAAVAEPTGRPFVEAGVAPGVAPAAESRAVTPSPVEAPAAAPELVAPAAAAVPELVVAGPPLVATPSPEAVAEPAVPDAAPVEAAVVYFSAAHVPASPPDDLLSADVAPSQPLESVVPDAPAWSAFPPAVAAALAPAWAASSAGVALAERPEDDDAETDPDEDAHADDAHADEEEGGSDLSPEELLNPRLIRRKRRKKKAREKASTAVDLRRRGQQMLRARKLDEAVACFSRLVAMQPNSSKAHRDLGAALLRDDRLEEAVAEFRKALELRPRFADAYGSLGDAYHLQGKLDQAISCYRNVLRLKPTAARAHSNLLLTLNYSHKVDPKAVFQEHLRWARHHAAPLARHIRPHANDCDPGRRLKVGYVSPDFRRHSVNYFVEPVLARHDHDRLAVYCYSDAIRPDDVTERIAGYCDGWRDVRGMTDDEVARLVRDDGIDVLVDLSGHTGTNRLLVFARKPAPVQVTYLGYPNTTGLSTIDYRVTDAYADPPGMTEALNTETLGWMPETFLCYAPPPEAPPAGEPPALAAGRVTFGCFNILAKVTPDVMALWARVLAAVPGSRLVMKDRSGVFAYAARRQYVRDIFRYHGIPADRLDLCDKEPDYAKHLDAYRRVDVMLDPFPYNGTTTTCEALWMGLPVVTLAGATHVGRVGVSILSNVELTDLIAESPEEYVRKAVDLASDRDGLLFLRDTLRDRMQRSPLMDAKRFTRSLEEMYRQMWRRWCEITARERATGAREDDGPRVTLTDE